MGALEGKTAVITGGNGGIGVDIVKREGVMPTHLGIDTTTLWSLVHPFSTEDQAAMATMRAAVEPNKGKLQCVEALVPFNAIMERVAAPVAIDYESGQNWRCTWMVVLFK